MNKAIKEYIIDQLKDLTVYHVNDEGTEHSVRCPYCGDSKDPTHSHLGIFIDVSEDSAMLWHCFRCGVGGQVNDEFLEDIGVKLDENEISQLRNYNKKLAKISKKGIIKTERFLAPLCEPTRLNCDKLFYINNRLGTAFTFQDAQVNKIVPSFMAFLKTNELHGIQNCPSWLPKVLERDYVGFLSTNNNLLTFRNIRENQNMRYYKIFVNPYNPDNATFYSIPTQLDLLYTGDLHVHIAEGTFDILSVRYNLRPNHPNQIFYASCGYSYMSILKHMARSGIVTHINLHVYADADKTDQNHIQMVTRSPIKEFIEHFYIHRNGSAGEKDYGVREENIIDKRRQIW